MIKPAYSVSFLLSINIFVWQNVLYFLDAPRTFGTVTLTATSTPLAVNDTTNPLSAYSSGRFTCLITRRTLSQNVFVRSAACITQYAICSHITPTVSAPRCAVTLIKRRKKNQTRHCCSAVYLTTKSLSVIFGSDHTVQRTYLFATIHGLLREAVICSHAFLHTVLR